MTASTTSSTATERVRDGDLREEGHLRLEEGHQLCEADLEVGRLFVHPETRLEYEDFHAYLAGKDPLPHWRNARIKEYLRACSNRLDDLCIGTDYGRGPKVSARACIADTIRTYDRSGRPFAAR